MSAVTAASVTPEPAEPGMAIEPELLRDLAKLTPPQLAAVTAVVRAMLPAERRPTPRDLMGSCAPLPRSLTMEELRAARDEIAAEVEANWDDQEGWL